MAPTPARTAAPGLPSGSGFRPRAWLAPLTAAAVLVLTLATAWSPGIDAAAAPPLFASGARSQPDATQVDRNAPPPKIRSTRDGALTASFGSLLLRQTNVFARQ